jgi:glycosyltransferase involved in cell wall biosynthesis
MPTPVLDAIAGLTAAGSVSPYPMAGNVKALALRLQFNISRLNSLKAILAPTRIMVETLRKFGVAGALIEHVPYGIDQSGFVATERISSGPDFVFGFIGTLARHKGCHLLIKAFRRLSTDSARLRIYGKKEDYPDYVRELEAEANGDPRIEFCGTFPNAEIGRVLDAIDTLVVPSVWYENAPLVVSSALAARRPVIASDFPGMAEIIRDGENGLLFPPGDVGELFSRLKAIASDRHLHARLSANCRGAKTIETYVENLCEIWSRRPSGEQSATAHEPESGISDHFLEDGATGIDKQGAGMEMAPVDGTAG